MATPAQGTEVRGGAETAAYEAGKRSYGWLKPTRSSIYGRATKCMHPPPSIYRYGWLKLKRDYIDGMGDSFDLVPVGAYMGRGKRAGAYGAYLLAAFDETSGSYQPICKLGSGLSDSELIEWSARLSGDEMGAEEAARVLDLPDDSFPAALAPHAWLRPSVVWEVSAAEVSVSPLYRAAYGAVDEHKGLALRFPRFVRARADKPPDEATTAAQLVSIFHNQPTTR
jgi:DNA ligase-1